jgi:hypothetical protein
VTWDASKFVAFDLETYLIEAGILAPPIVCGSWADRDGRSSVVGRDDALLVARGLLDSPVTVVGANVAYDMGCLAAWARRSSS